MKSTKPAGALNAVMVALATCLLASCTVEQLLIGQLYTIRTPQVGACPSLDWRFVVNGERMINGSLWREGQPQIASLTGVLNADDSFQMTATQPGANRTANVTGRFTAQVSTISIHGDVAGSGCDGQTFEPRLGAYFSRAGGGGGGGG